MPSDFKSFNFSHCVQLGSQNFQKSHCENLVEDLKFIICGLMSYSVLFNSRKRFYREPAPSQTSNWAESPFNFNETRVATCWVLLHLYLSVLDQDLFSGSERKELFCVVFVINLQVDQRRERLQGHCDLNLAIVTEHTLALAWQNLGAMLLKLLLYVLWWGGVLLGWRSHHKLRRWG